MKVLMVAQSFAGDGIGTVVHNLYESLHNREIKCDVACIAEPPKEYMEIIKNNGDNLFQIKQISEVGMLKYFLQIKHICKQNSYDVVHCHLGIVNWLAALGAKSAGVNCVVGHGHGQKTLNRGRRIIRRLEPIFRWLNYKFCDGKVGCTKESNIYTFGKRKNTIVLPNYTPYRNIYGVEKDTIKKVEHDIWDHRPNFVFCYMGNLSGPKNVIYLPEVIFNLRNRQIDAGMIIIGKGVKYDVLKEKIEELGLAPFVKLLGWRNDTNVLIQTSDYYLSMSGTEGMSLSMIEAQMSGKPCFVSSEIPKDSDLKIGLFNTIETFDPSVWARDIQDKITHKMVKPVNRCLIKELLETRNSEFTEYNIINTLINVYKTSK